MDLVFAYFWAIALVFVGINAAVIKMKSAQYVKENPELADGYPALLRGFILWMSLPWIVMGVGCTIGDIPNIWHYFRPRDGNPYVLAFFASVFLEWVAGTYWLLLRGGANTLAKYPGFLGKNNCSPTEIMVYWFLSLAGGVMGVIFMWAMDIPVPPNS